MEADPGTDAPPDALFRGRGITLLVAPFMVYILAMAAFSWLEGPLAGPTGIDPWYPAAYTAGLVATLVVLAAVGRLYGNVRFRVGWLSLVVGAVGVVVWVGFWWIDETYLGLGRLVAATREGFNPFEALAGSPWLWPFLGVRTLGLVAVVPLVEEFFLRGFVMRYLIAHDWDRVPLGKVTRSAAIGVVVYALASHPSEPLAAAAWFSLVTWLYARTGNLWDCVAAHAVTNLLLGVYIVSTGTWALW